MPTIYGQRLDGAAPLAAFSNPGEPFGWEATRLIGARVRTRVELEEIFGTPTRGEGLVSGAEAGRLCVRWDSPAGAPTTWFCRYHYDKFCTEASQT